IRDYVDGEISIGDYVLTGGELAAMVVSDAVIRLVDGVITRESHEDDSFSDGLIEYAHYTKPRMFDGKEVPEVLLSGHHENIRKFRLQSSLEKTLRNRPDLLEKRSFSKEEQRILEDIKKEK
ncbi:MAG: tRNA (guanosine(37)-N1)-methyltransferase TrmD, partial [Erysipelothrix sp.]|nr:tRNA (guanosine(37)-N1)-methyltransferase TrmD [Erysipelothrix sp.]